MNIIYTVCIESMADVFSSELQDPKFLDLNPQFFFKYSRNLIFLGNYLLGELHILRELVLLPPQRRARKFKKVQAKKLVKSNKSISRKKNLGQISFFCNFKNGQK